MSLPEWNQNIKVTTWARGVEKLLALRDYLIEDEFGNVMAKTTTTWMVLDAKTHRPVNPELVKQALAYTSPEKALDENAEKIVNPPISEGKLFNSITVNYTDVDHNGHAGNVRYPEWIMAGLPFDELKGKTVKSFAVNYIAEALANDTIDLYLFTNESPYRVSGVRRADSKLIFSAILEIS
jgi:acyl-ACP thioesterase